MQLSPNRNLQIQSILRVKHSASHKHCWDVLCISNTAFYWQYKLRTVRYDQQQQYWAVLSTDGFNLTEMGSTTKQEFVNAKSCLVIGSEHYQTEDKLQADISGFTGKGSLRPSRHVLVQKVLQHRLQLGCFAVYVSCHDLVFNLAICRYQV